MPPRTSVLNTPWFALPTQPFFFPLTLSIFAAQMSYYNANRLLCVCTELGCSQETFELHGELQTGVLFNRTNYPRHLEAIQQVRRETPQFNPSTSGRVPSPALATTFQTQLPTQPLHPAKNSRPAPSDDDEEDNSATRPRKALRHTDRSELEPGQIILTLNTERFKIPLVLLLHPQCIQALFNTLNDHLNHRKSRSSCCQTLKLERRRITEFFVISNQTDCSNEIPVTIEKVLNMFHLQTNLKTSVSCKVCFAIHDPHPIDTPHCPSLLSCNNLRFPSKTSSAQRITCDAPLYKISTTQKSSSSAAPATSLQRYRAHQLFFHLSLSEWLATMLHFPLFEQALETSLARNRSPPGVYADIWDGNVWSTFQNINGQIFTKQPGHLVFGLFCDWFNPFGKGSARHNSTGVILLFCLSLPPDMRYKKENIFLYAIIPGPKEPDYNSISHVFQPLMTELQELWRGLFLSSTASHPQGRLIRVALWPLLADSPAMKKISGFSSHNSTNFCTYCHITIDNINEVDVKAYKKRHQHSIKAQSQAWLNAPSASAQEKLVKKHGVRATPFANLSYWQPINFTTIDIMHCFLLGLLKDLSSNYLQIPAAALKLAKQTNNMQYAGNHTHPELTTFPAPIGSATPVPSLSSSATTVPTSTESSNGRTHYPREAKNSSSIEESIPLESGSNPSETSKDTQSTVQAPDGPSLTPHELQLIHSCIENTTVPSWLTRIPHKFGSASCGTPKAAEWIILYTLYMVILIIPYHHNAEKDSDSAKIHRAVILLIQIVNITTSRVLNEQDIKTLGALLHAYRQHLRAAWPNIKSKPNLHYAQHIPAQVHRFGPPAYLAVWAGERMIGTFVQTPKNHSTREFLPLLFWLSTCIN